MAAFTKATSTSTPEHQDTARAVCRVDPDGVVVVETGVVEMGTGNHSAFATIAADALGVSIGRVRVEQPAASEAPADDGTFASRSIYVSGNAVAAAAANLRSLVLAQVGRRFDQPVASLTIDDNGIHWGGGLAAWTDVAPARASGEVVSADNGLVAGAQMVDVAVDTFTGRVVVERVVSVHDVGRLLDEKLARGQVVGGIIQGIGMALTERSNHDADGKPIEVALLDQQVPSMIGLPQIDSLFVTDGRARGALGAKGLGEGPMVGITAAIANAICDATGVRLRRAPFLPERVLDALDAAGPLLLRQQRAEAPV